MLLKMLFHIFVPIFHVPYYFSIASKKSYFILCNFDHTTTFLSDSDSVTNRNVRLSTNLSLKWTKIFLTFHPGIQRSQMRIVFRGSSFSLFLGLCHSFLDRFRSLMDGNDLMIQKLVNT